MKLTTLTFISLDKTLIFELFQDKTSRMILLLRQEIQNLQLELMEYKQGKRIMGSDGIETTNDMYHGNCSNLLEQL